MQTDNNVQTAIGVATIGYSIRINAPQYFKRPDFITWLKSSHVATWDDKDAKELPHEHSDVFLLVDGSLDGEGTDSDGLFPSDIWSEIVEACRSVFPGKTFEENITVRLTNLEE